MSYLTQCVRNAQRLGYCVRYTQSTSNRRSGDNRKKPQTKPQKTAKNDARKRMANMSRNEERKALRNGLRKFTKTFRNPI